MGTGIGWVPRRRARGLGSLVSAALLTFGTGAAHAAAPGGQAASAQAAPGGVGVQRCLADGGAVVAVDFGPFGGPVQPGCDPDPTLGIELLEAAGFTTQGTVKDGPGFLCRFGHPDVDGGKQYPTPDTEPCTITPPAQAYWSYWHASRGERTWKYSSLGVLTRPVKPGDVEAWVFGATSIGGGTGGPKFTPDQVRGRVDLAAAGQWTAGQLKDGQRVEDENGNVDWYSTTEAAYALAAAQGRTPALAKVTDHLASPAADAYLTPPDDDGKPRAHAVARLALVAQTAGLDPRAFGGRDLIALLTSNVCTAADVESASPGCAVEGDFRHAESAQGQSHALLALGRAGLRPPAGTVERLLRQQCPDGGFAYSSFFGEGETCAPDVATTALAALVLHRAGGQQSAVTAARGYLEKEQRADGSHLAYDGATGSSAPVTAAAAQALRALGAADRADRAVAWTALRQRPEGGFVFEEGAEPQIHATAPVVLAGAGVDLATLTAKAPAPEPEPEPTDPDPKPTDPGPKPTDPDPVKPGPPPVLPAGGPDLAKAVTYLTRPAQLKRGGYYEETPGRADWGMTIDGAYALAATGRDDEALRGIVDYLDGRGKDGAGTNLAAWTGVGTPYMEGGKAGKAALLAQAVRRDPRDFAGQDLLGALREGTCTAPGKPGDRRCPAAGAYAYADAVFDQALGVMAQLRAGEKQAAASPVAYLSGLQQSSGAWPSLIPMTADPDVDSTAMAAMALDLADGEDAERRVERALAFLAERQLPGGGFRGASGTSVNSTALAVQALALDVDTYRPQIAKALKWLKAHQNADGGFDTATEEQGTNLRASAQAVSGATGVSFARLDRDLTATTPQPPTGEVPGPKPSAPVIVTPDDTGGASGTGGTSGAGGTSGGQGGGGAVAAQGGSGGLAATGAPVLGLAAAAALLTAAGSWAVVHTRRRRAAGER
ncbi:prenyltransferase/squalene oxidase repeat-containing protein [Streptomyces sp. ODS05-4]|uniref:prenyltransferase/squalene oxidase repeat-containing protein n=1 Tax=Streptomyces sp. ODS05-4 TaxID=2944939 RepID=UPI00210D5388|nr:prenyltransferase/squalene oxidase repeat-containing protein [Streptomyces sp. ODS05-4]